VSDTRYTHFSLLKTLEAGFRLPCLNHACDAGVNVMADLFATTAIPSVQSAANVTANLAPQPATQAGGN
jgi:hypothetical protein